LSQWWPFGVATNSAISAGKRRMLRWRYKGALAGGWLREEKKLERWG